MHEFILQITLKISYLRLDITVGIAKNLRINSFKSSIGLSSKLNFQAKTRELLVDKTPKVK